MRKIFGLILFLFLFPIANAIVIVSPTIYFVTLSIATFIANSIIGFLALIAVSGMLNKTFFGKKVSEIFAFLFVSIKKFVIGIISMIIALLLINPIEISSIIQGAIVAAVIFGLLFLLSEYSKFKISISQKKNNILKSATIFSLLVLIIFTFSALTSLEIKVIAGDDSQPSLGADQKQDSFLDVFNDSVSEVASAPAARESISPSAGKPSPQEDYAPSYDNIEEKKIILNELLFFPENKEKCKVKVGEQSFVFEPQYSCYSAEGLLPERIYCPVKVSFYEINQLGDVQVIATGSCKDSFAISLESGFRVEVS